MNKKGEVNLGSIMVFAVAAIVAIVLIQASAQSLNNVQNLGYVRNNTVTIPAAINTSITLEGKNPTNMFIINATSGLVVNANNYTTTSYNLTSTGQLASYLVWTKHGFNGTNVNISYNYEPLEYDTSSGGRTIAGIVILLSAVALAVVLLTPIRETVRDLL